MQIRWVFFLLLCLFSAGSSSQVPSSSEINKLSSSEQWLRLLHYEADGLLSPSLKSAVISPEFFLSEHGASNPKAELVATITAFLDDTDYILNKSPQCLFPARFLWLRQQGYLNNVVAASCPDYEKFTAEKTVDSISVIFATGYLGNPASYYGHTLIKLGSSARSRKLLDASVNYGAIVPDGVGPLSYIYNGVMGGYDGGFSHIGFYFHNHNYGESELRDMWEYKLNLTLDEVALIAAHSWEVIGIRFKYYFFRENCSFRTAQVLNVVTRLDIDPGNIIYSIPQNLIRQLQINNDNNDALLSEVVLHPSRQRRFRQSFQTLSPPQKTAFNKIVETGVADVSEFYQQLPSDGKHPVIDAGLDYLRYKQALTSGPQQNISSLYQELLQERFRLPPKNYENIDFDLLESPHLGRNPSYFSLGFYKELNDVFVSARIRPAYYDSYDSTAGHVQYGTLSMAELGLDFNDSNISVDYFDIINIESVQPSLSALIGDRSDAWRLRAGLQRQFNGCGSCLVARLQADKGMPFAIGDHLVITGYLGGAINESKNGEGYGFSRASVSAIARVGDWSFGSSLEQRYSFENSEYDDFISSVTVRYKVKGNFDLRLTFSHDRAESLGLNFGYYW